MAKLADLQDKLGVLQAYPCNRGGTRGDLAAWTATKVAVLSAWYSLV